MNDSNPTLKVAFVGVGAIGLPMALRIQQAGFEITAVEPGPTQLLVALGAGLPHVVDSVAAVDDCRLVIVMVATPAQLSRVVDVALDSSPDQSGRTWVIMSTVGPQSVTAEADRLAAAGAWIVDAPVTGGVIGARSGTLRIFTSGSPAAVALAAGVLSACGTVSVVGDAIGLGQSVKVINQHLCTVHLAAAAEALALTHALGLDPEVVLGLVGYGAGGSWMLQDRGPRMLDEASEVTSTVGIFVKDSGLVAEAAGSVGLDIPVLEAARARFLAAAELGLVSADDSQVIRTYQ